MASNTKSEAWCVCNPYAASDLIEKMAIALRLYVVTYMETQRQPTASEEAKVMNAVREAMKGIK